MNNPEKYNVSDSIRDVLSFAADQATITQFKQWFDVLCKTSSKPELVQNILNEMNIQGWIRFSIDSEIVKDTLTPQFRIFFLGIVAGIHQNIELIAVAEDITGVSPQYIVTFRTIEDQRMFLQSLNDLGLDSSNDMTFTDGLAVYVTDHCGELLLPPEQNFSLKIDESTLR